MSSANLVLVSALFFILFSCTTSSSEVEKSPTAGFDLITTGSLSGTPLNEASGLAPSYKYPGLYWVHNDRNDLARIFLIDSTGSIKATVNLKTALNQDWEDIATYKDPSTAESYIYIGDIGDNFKEFDHRVIYRVKEPDIQLSSTSQSVNIDDFDSVAFTYPDGKRDAETLLVDPHTGQILIITKFDPQSVVYTFPQSFSWSDTVELEKQGALSMIGVVGGDISPDGSEVLLKTYPKVFHWTRISGEDVFSTFQANPVEITSYQVEPQGEAICWTLSGKDFLTVTECTSADSCGISYYQRKNN